jgi:hypothetical protein
MRPPIHGKARRLHYMDFDAALNQKTRQTESVAPGFMGENHPLDIVPRHRATSL